MRRQSELWLRAIAVWLLIMLAETTHGIVRRLFISPYLGELTARKVGVVVGSILIFAIVWLLFRWMKLRTLRQQLSVGIVWVLLTAVFEFALGTALGLSCERMLADYDVAKGGWMGFGLLFLMCAPMLAARIRSSLTFQ